ncbi:MAG: hypothetical protein COA91_08350 [Robiginitomaculum sp.]|nr:MAG: hypothetical protein COA91_08350 [Robiginitomaculum sp.]
MSIFTNWTDAHTRKFQNDIMCVNHNLASTGLFSDGALADMLDNHPDHMLDVCTMGKDKMYPNKFRTGDFRGCDGKSLIEMVQQGKLYINARRAMNLHPQYNEILQQMYAELSEKTGNKEFNANGGILISSPIAKVPYHTDRQHVVLWHIHGTKRVYVYPMANKFMSDTSYEAVATNTLLDDLPYEDVFDEDATVLTLKGGEMACWQLNQPHRVVNETFCVSIASEYSDHTSALKNSAMYAQAAMRSRFSSKPVWKDTAPPIRLAKAVAGKILKKSGLYKTTITPDFVTFKVDKTAPGYIVDIEPVQRDF